MFDLSLYDWPTCGSRLPRSQLGREAVATGMTGSGIIGSRTNDKGMGGSGSLCAGTGRQSELWSSIIIVRAIARRFTAGQ